MIMQRMYVWVFLGCVGCASASEETFIKEKKRAPKESKNAVAQDVVQAYEDQLLVLRKLAREVGVCEDTIITTIVDCVHKDDELSSKSKVDLCDLRTKLKTCLDACENMIVELKKCRATFAQKNAASI